MSGWNVTGLSAFVTELSGKRIELLKETFPSVSTVGFLNNLGNPVAPPQWKATRPGCVATSAHGRLVERAKRS